MIFIDENNIALTRLSVLLKGSNAKQSWDIAWIAYLSEVVINLIYMQKSVKTIAIVRLYYVYYKMSKSDHGQTSI